MADLLLTNARIWTGDASRPWAETALVRGGNFAGVGAANQFSVASGVETLDARAQLVVPGLVDGHVHLHGTGSAMQQVALKGTKTVEEAITLVAERVTTTRPGDWIQGTGWDQNSWRGQAFPTATDLDSATPNNPVLLSHTSGHCTWVNSAAMRTASIDASTVAPDGGAIDRDANGEATGILRDHASNLVYSVIPRPSAADRKANLLAAQTHAHRLGLTGVHAMDVRMTEMESLEGLRGDGLLTLRVRAYVAAQQLDRFQGRRTGDGDDLLRIAGTKFFSDGALGSLTAWMDEPFDGTDNRGFPLQPIEELEERVRLSLSMGLAPAIHAIGDRANGEVLGLLERLCDVAPGLVRRVEHAQLLADRDAARFSALGITASVQPIHLTQDFEKVDRFWGSRGRFAYIFRSMLDAGVNLAFGSDTPVETMDPLAGIHAAATRQQADGSPFGGWYADERVSVEEAVQAFSAGCAAAVGEEDRFGRIAAGYAADFVILDRDILDLKDASDILRARVAMTVIGGNVVYDREG